MNDTLNVACFSSDLISAYESLNESEKELKDVQLIMHNVQESITLLNTYGQESIKVLNADQGLENLLKISEKSMTVERVLEGFGQTMSDAWKRFVDIVKKIIDRIHVWLSTLINKIRSSTPSLREKKLSISLPERGYSEEKCVAATKGGAQQGAPFGQSYVTMMGRFKQLTQAARNISQYVEISDVAKAKEDASKLFFESIVGFYPETDSSGHGLYTTEWKSNNDGDEYTTPHQYIVNTSELAWFGNSSEINDTRGYGLGWVKLLEEAQKDIFDALVAFDSAYDVYSKRLVKRIESEENAEKRELYQTILKGLSAASSSNGAYWATLNSIISRMLKKYEQIVLKNAVGDTKDVPSNLVDAYSKFCKFIDNDYIPRLKAYYNKEPGVYTRPSYDAQEKLTSDGVTIMDVTKVQKIWIVKHGGKGDAHPPMREVERICKHLVGAICPRCGWEKTPGDKKCRNCGTQF